jgi:hypothetical protein
MSIRREQEHVSLALSAVVSIPRHIGSLLKRRCNERMQTSPLRSPDFSVFWLIPLFQMMRRPADGWLNATRKYRQVEFTKRCPAFPWKICFGQHFLRYGEEEKHSAAASGSIAGVRRTSASGRATRTFNTRASARRKLRKAGAPMANSDPGSIIQTSSGRPAMSQ